MSERLTGAGWRRTVRETWELSTPGWEPSLGGFPALSVAPGQFILKDAVLLGAAIWSLGEALRHVGSSD